MKKALILVSLLLASCATNINELEIPTSDTANYKHKRFNERTEAELSPKDYKLLQKYIRENKDSSILVGEAVKIQSKKQSEMNLAVKEAEKLALEENIRVTKEKIKEYKELSKKYYLYTRGLDDSQVKGLVSRDLEISNFRLTGFKVNKIEYLSPNNPNKYRYNLEYKFDISNMNRFEIMTATYEFSLKHDLEDIDVSRQVNISTYFTKKFKNSKYIKFTFTSPAKLTREEMEQVLPSTRIIALKDKQFRHYTISDFTNYKEKLMFRLEKMEEMLADLEKADKTPYNFERKFLKNFTFNPKLYSTDQDDFKDYLINQSGF